MYSPQTRIAPVPDAHLAPAAPAALPTAERQAEGLIDDCVRQLAEARLRTRAVMASLDGEALLGPRLPIVNPPLWELGHLGWFQERWMVRPRGDGALAPSSLAGADALYDSAQVAHSVRWDLPLPSLAATWAWLDQVMALALEGVERKRRHLGDLPGATAYFAQLAARHEQMHSEAFVYSAQTLGYAAPAGAVTARCGELAGSRPASGAYTDEAVSGGDVEIAGGRFLLGAESGTGFVFDNEKWAHPVSVEPYAIARCATRVAEYLAFVEDGGYAERRWWSEAGWAWREQAQASAPVYWRRRQRRQGWEQRRFQHWEALSMDQPMIHVNAHEAAAWCVWAGRRLPTEAEWEFAAATAPGGGPDVPGRRHPWGDTRPGSALANLWSADGASGASLRAAGALAAGDSAWGCRQMIGNVWEWTASRFQPYPGFVTDPYREYSEPWFGTHQVLRGGCFATAADLIRNTWRNFYTPERRDVFAGFRSCAGGGR